MARRRVLIDLRMVQPQMHGIARYALELARRLPDLEPSWEFSALSGPDGLPSDLGELTPKIPVHLCRAASLTVFEQPALTASLAKLRPELFHATSFSMPLLWPGKLVATLHDANHLALAHQYGLSQLAYYRLIVRPRAEWASALLTVSEFSREELARHLKLPPERFQVIHNGVDARFRPASASELKALRQRYALPERYFLVVGNDKPFKNLQLAAKVASALPVPVVLLAGSGARSAFHFPESTRELSRIPESDLPALYGGALALLLPSLYEGFGLPALEAMACGTPVLATHGTALPEICGSAAMLLPGEDAEAWVEASLRLLRDERLRRELSEKGRERADRFSWDACAKKTLAAYRRILRE